MPRRVCPENIRVAVASASPWHPRSPMVFLLSDSDTAPLFGAVSEPRGADGHCSAFGAVSEPREADGRSRRPPDVDGAIST